MKNAFVIGHPVAHSRSPKIHGHWLKTYGIAGSYDAIDVAPEAMEAFFERIYGGEFVGGNVTVPLKEIAFRLADTHDLDTVHIGATNTLETLPTADGRPLIHGSNTDQYGFLANLDDKAPGWDEGRRRAIVLGAGGAARAIVSALLSRLFPEVHILNRTPEKAEELVRSIRLHMSSMHPGALDRFAELAPGADVVVNTTTIGMHGTRFDGLALDRLPKHALVTDLVYVPLRTPLLADAAALGLRTVDGLGMLLHQAVPGFEAWFGVRPEVTPELRALIEATL